MAAAQAAEKHGGEWDLTWYLPYNDEYIQQFQPESTHKMHQQ